MEEEGFLLKHELRKRKIRRGTRKRDDVWYNQLSMDLFF